MCSGGSGQIDEEAGQGLVELPKPEVNGAGALNDRESKILAARERFLARKVNK